MLQLEIFDYSLGEILAWFADPVIVGWVLIGSGILAAAWLLENMTDPIPLLGTIFDGLVKLGTFVGFFVGFLDILVGYVAYVTQPDAVVVAGILILVGFTLVMRVLSKFPLALVFAAACAGFATFTIYGLLAPFAGAAYIGETITQIISLKWMLVIGAVLFFFFYGIFGLLINLVKLIGRIFSSTPILVIIGLAAIGVGIIVLAAPALLGIVLPWPAP
ncbi:MAG: hypothetical protein ACTSU3_07730 [Candidatus Thorarchaeota archaeon]